MNVSWRLSKLIWDTEMTWKNLSDMKKMYSFEFINTETSQLIYNADQLSSAYMMRTLPLNVLS